jgi:hypothetical protein
LLSIVIAASCALLFAIATDELFTGLNLNGEIAVGLCVEVPVLLNIWEFPHRSRQSSYHTQFILTEGVRLSVVAALVTREKLVSFSVKNGGEGTHIGFCFQYENCHSEDMFVAM